MKLTTDFSGIRGTGNYVFIQGQVALSAGWMQFISTGADRLQSRVFFHLC